MMRSGTKLRVDDEPGKAAPIFADRPRVEAGCPDRASRATHDFAALAFYVAGSTRMDQRAIWTLETGDVLVVPPGEAHRAIDMRQPAFWRLGFCVPCLPAETAAILMDPFERVRDGASPVVRIAPDRRAFLAGLFNELTRTAAVGPKAAAVRHSLLTLIINEVGYAAAWSRHGNAGTDIVAKSLRFIERHCLQPITLDAIAAAVGRTPAHITTALTRATGRSAGAWITAARMAEARRRLLHSDESVESIAERVGYADATHFIRLFRRTHGVTPAAWRAERRAALSRQRTGTGQLHS